MNKYPYREYYRVRRVQLHKYSRAPFFHTDKGARVKYVLLEAWGYAWMTGVGLISGITLGYLAHFYDYL